VQFDEEHDEQPELLDALLPAEPPERMDEYLPFPTLETSL
jgi:hypothetical protein